MAVLTTTLRVARLRNAPDGLLMRALRHHMRAWSVGVAAAVALGASAELAHGAAQDSDASVKAAFIMNFAKFTEWPAGQVEDRTVLCVTDPDVAAALESLASKKPLGQRTAIVRRLTLDEPVSDCALLYVGNLRPKDITRVLTQAKGLSVLTISEAEEFAERGGVIQLYLERTKMRFAVNIDAATEAHLKLSVQVLQLARIVK